MKKENRTKFKKNDEKLEEMFLWTDTSTFEIKSSKLIKSHLFNDKLENDFEEFGQKELNIAKNENPSSEEIQTLNRIENQIKEKYDLSMPSFTVEVGDDVILEQDDLNKFFSEFGEITYLNIAKSKFSVLFKYYVSCLFAYSKLNHLFESNGISGRIQLQKRSKAEDDSLKQTYGKILKDFVSQSDFLQHKINPTPFQYCQPIFTSPQIHPTFYYTNPHIQNHIQHSILSSREQKMKYLGTYYIQIEQDTEFKVVSKIIGYKGHFLKAIINESEKEAQLKIRLRGKGSGFKTTSKGNEQEAKEENIPLQLCVSALDAMVFDKACSSVEAHLLSIYDVYSNFLKQKGINKTSPKLKLDFQICYY